MGSRLGVSNRLAPISGTSRQECPTRCISLTVTFQLAGELTVSAREPGFIELLGWGRELDPERIWAIEDCRHVSGALERFLVAAGELVVRIPPKLMGQSRRAERTAGKSDPIDALAIARAALREGPETLPAAHLDAGALQMKLLLDHREDIVKARSEDQQRLRWHLHDLWPELELPTGCLDRIGWLDRLARRLSRAGVAPIPASSGKRVRHRLDRGGNRQLNCACTASPSPKDVSIRQPGSSWRESRPKESPGWRRCAASSATWPAGSGGC